MNLLWSIDPLTVKYYVMHKYVRKVQYLDVSDWLLFSTNQAIFQQIIFCWDNDDVCFVLDQHT